MRTFKLALITTYILTSAAAFANCPPADDVQKALKIVLKYDQLSHLMLDALKNSNVDISKIDKEAGVGVLDVDLSQPMTLKQRNLHGSTNCDYSIKNRVLVRFDVKE